MPITYKIDSPEANPKNRLRIDVAFRDLGLAVYSLVPFLLQIYLTFILLLLPQSIASSILGLFFILQNAILIAFLTKLQTHVKWFQNYAEIVTVLYIANAASVALAKMSSYWGISFFTTSEAFMLVIIAFSYFGLLLIIYVNWDNHKTALVAPSKFLKTKEACKFLLYFLFFLSLAIGESRLLTGYVPIQGCYEGVFGIILSIFFLTIIFDRLREGTYGNAASLISITLSIIFFVCSTLFYFLKSKTYDLHMYYGFSMTISLIYLICNIVALRIRRALCKSFALSSQIFNEDSILVKQSKSDISKDTAACSEV